MLRGTRGACVVVAWYSWCLRGCCVVLVVLAWLLRDTRGACVVSDFRRDINDNGALLGNYAA